MQLRGVLPIELGVVIDEAAAFERGQALVTRLNNEEHISVIELSVAIADARCFLRSKGSTEAVTTLVSALEEGFAKCLKSWTASYDSIFKFRDLHAKFEVVLEACTTGVFTGCEWMTKAEDETISSQMKMYQGIAKNAPYVHKFARAVCNALTAHREEQEAADMCKYRDEAQHIINQDEKIQLIIFNAAVGNLRLVKPRPHNFNAQLKHMMKAFTSKSFDPEKRLCKYLTELFSEATKRSAGDSIDAKDESQSKQSQPAVAKSEGCPQAGAGQGSASKQRSLSGAAALLAKRRKVSDSG